MAPPDPYLTAAEVRTRQPDLQSATAWPDEMLAELVESFEERIEGDVGFGVAYRVREATVSVTARSGAVVLPHVMVDPASVSIVRATGDVSVPSTHVSGHAGVIRSHLAGDGEITVSYEHGYPKPPVAMLQACSLWVWHEAKAQRTPATNNSYARYNPDAGGIERISSADPDAGRITGWLDVDRLLSGIPRSNRLGFA